MKRSDKPRGMTATGKTREAVIVFFDAIIERRFSDADKALEEVRNKKNTNPEFPGRIYKGTRRHPHLSTLWGRKGFFQ